jgi:hypothetical protein
VTTLLTGEQRVLSFLRHHGLEDRFRRLATEAQAPAGEAQCWTGVLLVGGVCSRILLLDALT